MLRVNRRHFLTGLLGGAAAIVAAPLAALLPAIREKVVATIDPDTREWTLYPAWDHALERDLNACQILAIQLVTERSER